MITTESLRLKFTVYMATGDRDDAVDLARHIPALLDIIDTQARMIEVAAKTFDDHLGRLKILSTDMRDEASQ